MKKVRGQGRKREIPTTPLRSESTNNRRLNNWTLKEYLSLEDIERTLQETGGHVSLAAELLGLSPETIRDKLRQYAELKAKQVEFRESDLYNEIIRKGRFYIEQILDCFEEMNGNLTNIAKRVGISLRYLHYLRERNPDFAEAIHVEREKFNDYAEEALIVAAKTGDIRAATTILKARAKDRGYGYENQNPKNEVQITVRHEDILGALADKSKGTPNSSES